MPLLVSINLDPQLSSKKQHRVAGITDNSEDITRVFEYQNQFSQSVYIFPVESDNKENRVITKFKIAKSNDFYEEYTLGNIQNLSGKTIQLYCKIFLDKQAYNKTFIYISNGSIKELIFDGNKTLISEFYIDSVSTEQISLIVDSQIPVNFEREFVIELRGVEIL
jgi:hypothetical protein